MILRQLSKSASPTARNFCYNCGAKQPPVPPRLDPTGTPEAKSAWYVPAPIKKIAGVCGGPGRLFRLSMPQSSASAGCLAFLFVGTGLWPTSSCGSHYRSRRLA